ncbi:MAG: error-prone DNA polymerase, partial [Mycobacteriaceae bacterium]|nr:error-prone DNA polymerase [Mycobacteriaceae bacterium]
MNVHPAGPRHAEAIHLGGLPPRPATAAETLALAPNVWPRNLTRGDDGVVRIAGVAVTDLAAQYGTPLFVIDEDDFRSRCREMAAAFGGGNVHYAVPSEYELFTAFAALGSRRSLDDHDGYLPAGPANRLRSPADMDRMFGRYPGAVAESVRIARECAFELKRATPHLPKFDLPEGQTVMGRLRELVWAAVPRLYPNAGPDVTERIERELTVIDELDFPGYFLIVSDFIREGRNMGVFIGPGRGSAAGSAVAYCIGITNIDPIKYNLLFERFLNPDRKSMPD